MVLNFKISIILLNKYLYLGFSDLNQNLCCNYECDHYLDMYQATLLLMQLIMKQSNNTNYPLPSLFIDKVSGFP